VGRNPEAVLDAALAGRFDIIPSPVLLEGLRRVLAHPSLQAVIGNLDEIVELVALTAIVVTPPRRSRSPATPTTTASSKPPGPH
jgi:hypothetical protein